MKFLFLDYCLKVWNTSKVLFLLHSNFTMNIEGSHMLGKGNFSKNFMQHLIQTANVFKAFHVRKLKVIQFLVKEFKRLTLTSQSWNRRVREVLFFFAGPAYLLSFQRKELLGSTFGEIHNHNASYILHPTKSLCNSRMAIWFYGSCSLNSSLKAT